MQIAIADESVQDNKYTSWIKRNNAKRNQEFIGVSEMSLLINNSLVKFKL